MTKIAIQGIEGSFHDIASHLYFKDKDISLTCCDTFEQVFEAVKKDPEMLAVKTPSREACCTTTSCCATAT